MPGTLKQEVDISSLPTIDFANFGDGTGPEARAISEKFFTACRDVGFAYLINTGIPKEQVDGMFDWSAKFFALPHDVKMLAPHPPEGSKHRGYSGIGKEQVSQMVFDPEAIASIRKGPSPDFKESFDMGNDADTSRLSNVWLPEDKLPGFKEYAVGFFECCRQFQVEKLMPALAMGLSLPSDFFSAFHETADNQLRLLHYPEAERQEFVKGEKGRIGAHTDFGTCTLLFQDSVGGLEVESPSKPGVFLPGPPVEGAIVFNIGDFLMRWSNDTLKSTLHRVRAPPLKDGEAENGKTKERFSIPYFMTADREKTIDCLPTCWNETDRPRKYEPINAGQYIDMRLNATY
ncbi:flavonol synthase/flavanone 3-hydroxylase [Stereum hirsutum FP-91666 SS1]|uniref:flavonol synthase/flavanone 3-hydroxylase n=1 Tax=Stereum hirsutum (strain FP-91666) TaxID=721885 RepID=UPI00044493E1|nr:flavonol synthase/flavanone 3-hydroxylase [Stereum hirsutum FP-91666 SS1]EIM84154.1 flavonol synthase/flavanone 3-hydroxylase [Stereum hirsutum FP-91666 SS1]